MWFIHAYLDKHKKKRNAPSKISLQINGTNCYTQVYCQPIQISRGLIKRWWQKRASQSLKVHLSFNVKVHIFIATKLLLKKLKEKNVAIGKKNTFILIKTNTNKFLIINRMHWTRPLITIDMNIKRKTHNNITYL